MMLIDLVESLKRQIFEKIVGNFTRFQKYFLKKFHFLPQKLEIIKVIIKHKEDVTCRNFR